MLQKEPTRHARAIQCTVFGEPRGLIAAGVELLAPGSGQVRVAFRAAGVNFADYLIVAGKYQIKPALPFTPGLEAAGEIVELGPGMKDFQLGQRVAVVTRPGGCFATGAVIDAAHVVPLPGAIDFVTAACMPVAYGTAHFALSRRGRLRAGETLLVTGAAGGVGLAAVEVGKALGARVIAAARGQDRLDLARSRGADELVDYGAESLRERVKALTGGSGADVILDPVGGDVFDECLRVINNEGRILVVGFAGGRIPSVPANRILIKNCSIVGVDYGTEMDGPPALRARLTEVFSWCAQRRLKPHIFARLPSTRLARPFVCLPLAPPTGRSPSRCETIPTRGGDARSVAWAMSCRYRSWPPARTMRSTRFTRPQLSNRFEPAFLRRWTLTDEYLRLLASFEVALPLERPPRLAELTLARKILGLSEGTIGEISVLLTCAALAAIERGTEREKLIKIGAKVISHGRYVAFQMAEVAIPRASVAEIMRLIADLRSSPAPVPM